MYSLCLQLNFWPSLGHELSPHMVKCVLGELLWDNGVVMLHHLLILLGVLLPFLNRCRPTDCYGSRLACYMKYEI